MGEVDQSLKTEAPSFDITTLASNRNWIVHGNYGPHPFVTGTRPVSLYRANDPNPYSKRWMGKDLSFRKGDPVSIVLGLVSDYASAKLNAWGVIKNIGVNIIGDNVSAAYNSHVCFASKFTYYKAVINNRVVFGDAYIESQYLVRYDYITRRESYILYNPVYTANRGTEPILIARNAQVKYMSM